MAPPGSIPEGFALAPIEGAPGDEGAAATGGLPGAPPPQHLPRLSPNAEQQILAAFAQQQQAQAAQAMGGGAMGHAQPRVEAPPAAAAPMCMPCMGAAEASAAAASQAVAAAAAQLQASLAAGAQAQRPDQHQA